MTTNAYRVRCVRSRDAADERYTLENGTVRDAKTHLFATGLAAFHSSYRLGFRHGSGSSRRWCTRTCRPMPCWSSPHSCRMPRSRSG
jgi:hypothetical protein